MLLFPEPLDAHPVSVLLDVSSQCNQSPPPRSHTDTSSTANWSRHLIQQTLMDEGLRLARMVSHDRAGLCMSLASEGIHSTGDSPSNEWHYVLNEAYVNRYEFIGWKYDQISKVKVSLGALELKINCKWGWELSKCQSKSYESSSAPCWWAAESIEASPPPVL